VRDAFGIASSDVPVSAMAFVAAAKELPPTSILDTANCPVRVGAGVSVRRLGLGLTLDSNPNSNPNPDPNLPVALDRHGGVG